MKNQNGEGMLHCFHFVFFNYRNVLPELSNSLKHVVICKLKIVFLNDAIFFLVRIQDHEY